ncbi:hypothetical protein [Rhodococcus sp. H29-C3]|uniref:hypothetical protein n=1 Tax=Rhodococcus sp. H29-C3 TaxID=3046307 RepID=UPI0024B88701|nr:hypothetical protein [Rhodococcus sp. H29-C3]MDJ0363121.1 hypothetical protein [Rhodococcus sp. H29-C3]
MGIAGAIQLVWARGTGQEGKESAGTGLMFSGFVVAVCGVVIGQVIKRSDGDSGPEAVNPAPVDALAVASTPAPAPIIEAPAAGPTDWTALIWVLGSVAAIAVLALAWCLIMRTRSHIADRKVAARGRADDFAAALDIYSDVVAAYAGYLTDPCSIFVRPLLDNVDDPFTGAFITAFAEAGDLRTERCPDDAARITAFAGAASAARSAWKKADEHARAIGMGMRTSADKRTIGRIESALTLALDDAATPAERDAALTAVHRLSEGMLTIPDRVAGSVRTQQCTPVPAQH